MRTCSVCSWPPRTVGAINKCLLAGMTLTAVHRKYDRPGRPISVSAIRRHSLHVLSPSEVGKGNRNVLPGADVSGVSGKSLLERVEELIKKHEGLAETATDSGQIIAAVAALREIRANLEMLGKLSGELANANINFYAIDITQERIKEFFDAAKLRSPQLGNYVQEQANRHFGPPSPPKVHVHFVSRPGLAPPNQIITGKDIKGDVYGGPLPDPPPLDGASAAASGT